MRYLKIYLREILKSLLIVLIVIGGISLSLPFLVLLGFAWPMELAISSLLAVGLFMFLTYFFAFFTAAYFANPQCRVQSIMITAFVWWLFITTLNIVVYKDATLLQAIFDLYYDIAVAIIALLILHLFRRTKQT